MTRASGAPGAYRIIVETKPEHGTYAKQGGRSCAAALAPATVTFRPRRISKAVNVRVRSKADSGMKAHRSRGWTLDVAAPHLCLDGRFTLVLLFAITGLTLNPRTSAWVSRP